MGILYDRLLILLNESSSDSTFYHIALAMLQNMELLHSLAINEVADLCRVSKSTISKFIRALGYEDYAEFREAARLEENKYHVSYNFSVDVIGYLESHSVQEYTQEIAKDIQLTAQQLDWDAVDRLVDDLIYYKKVFALGMMFSGTQPWICRSSWAAAASSLWHPGTISSRWTMLPVRTRTRC